MVSLKEIILKKSKFVHSYRRRDIVALYNSKEMEVIYVNDNTLKIFNSFNGNKKLSEILLNYSAEEKEKIKSFTKEFLKRNFLVPSEANEKFEFSLPNNPIEIRLMYLFPTDRCNLRCEYCFIENSFNKDYSFANMPKEIMKRGLDLFFKISSKNLNEDKRIIFYGGEPLLNWSVVRFGIDYIRRHKTFYDTDIHLITNGTIMNEDIAKFLKETKVNVSLSIDGPREVHDLARRSSDGSGSYLNIKKTYEILKKEGVDNIGISLTVHKFNVENLPNIVEELVKTFDIKGIGFNFLTDFYSSKNPFSVDINLATSRVLEAFDFLRNKGIYEERIMRKLRPFVEKEFHLKDCGAIGNQIVISPDGRIGPCHAFISSKEYFNHDVFEDNIDLLNDSVFLEWSKRMPINMEKCKNCAAIAICGGGCPYQAKITKESIWDLDERMCEHNNLFLEWAIWDAYNKNESYFKTCE
ncbi:MAG: SPASM domain-containing protein [Candidatus Pacearchaeota archaeon]